MNKKYIEATIFLIYIIISIIYTWPLITKIDVGFISPDYMGDSSSYIWDIYIFKSNLFNHTPLFHANQILSPIGGNLLMHGYMPGLCLYSLMFDNDVLALNTYILLHFVISAYGAYKLSYFLNKNHLISFVIGFIFSFSAYKMLRLSEHYNLTLTATIPLYIYYFIQTFDFNSSSIIPKINSFKYLIFCFLLGILTVLNDYYATFYLIYFSFAWIFFYKVYPYWTTFSTIKKTFIPIIIFILMHLIIEPLVIHGIDDKGGFWWGGNMLSYFIPNNNSWLYNNQYLQPLTNIAYFGRNSFEYQLFIGYGIIVCIFFLLYSKIKNQITMDTKPWLFISLFFFLLTTPIIYFGTQKIIYSPTSIIHFIPFFNNIRCNTRAIVLLELSIPIATSIVWKGIIEKNNNKLYSIYIPLSFFIFVFIEFKPNNYNIVEKNSIPNIYENINKSSKKTLTTIPTGIMDGMKSFGKFNNLEQYYQTIHKKNITGGYLSRVSDEVFQTYLTDSIMYDLLKFSENKNELIKYPSQQTIEMYFKKFKTDMFLIYPEFKKSNAEKFIMYLIKNKKTKITELNNYTLIEVL